jgi:hypothetical protein
MTLQQEGNLLLLRKIFPPRFPSSKQAEIESHCARDLGFKAWNPWISRIHVPSKLGMLGFLECMFRAWNAFGFSECTPSSWNAWISRIYILIWECLEFQKVYSELECFEFPRMYILSSEILGF